MLSLSLSLALGADTFISHLARDDRHYHLLALARLPPRLGLRLRLPPRLPPPRSPPLPPPPPPLDRSRVGLICCLARLSRPRCAKKSPSERAIERVVNRENNREREQSREKSIERAIERENNRESNRESSQSREQSKEMAVWRVQCNVFLCNVPPACHTYTRSPPECVTVAHGRDGAKKIVTSRP